MTENKIKRLTRCALIAAIAYIGFQFLRIDIPVGTERTAIHLGNAFVVIGALIEGAWGGFAGALGLTLADLTSGYLTSAPKTFILKLVMGLIANLVAKTLRKHNNKNTNPCEPTKDGSQKEGSNKKTGMLFETKLALLSSVVSLGVNVFLDPIFGYFYKTYIIGVPQDLAATLSKIGSVTTLVNAVVSCIIVTILWPALAKALRLKK